MRGMGFTNVCILYVFFCLFGIRSHLPTHTLWIWHWGVRCKLNSLAALFSAKKYISNQSPCVCGESASGRFYWSSPFSAKQTLKCSSVLISRSAVTESIFKKMLELWLASCSSHHVECTKIWMRDLSSVCGSLNSQPNHTRITVQDSKREQSSGNWQ